jgi:hypothetical protein
MEEEYTFGGFECGDVMAEWGVVFGLAGDAVDGGIGFHQTNSKGYWLTLGIAGLRLRFQQIAIRSEPIAIQRIPPILRMDIVCSSSLRRQA